MTSLENWVLALERSRDQHREAAVSLQLYLEDMEDRSRRSNLRLRGIPEDAEAEDLDALVRDMFRTILEDPEADIILDRAHRALGPRSPDPARPRDVVCRLHRYAQKEDILHRAWDFGDLEVSGSRIKILPDLSGATLKRRALLRPLLELARQKGCTYRWGYPLAVTFRKEARAFTLRSPAELQALFQFLEADPMPIPDWLQLLPRMTGRSGVSNIRGPVPPRLQRGRRCQREASGGARE